MQPEVSAGQQGRWEEKLGLEQGQQRPGTLLGQAGIPKEKWEPTSVAHHVNSDNAGHLQKTSVLFPRALPCAWPGTWRSWRRRSGCTGCSSMPARTTSISQQLIHPARMSRAPTTQAQGCVTLAFQVSGRFLFWPTLTRNYMGKGILGNIVPA